MRAMSRFLKYWPLLAFTILAIQTTHAEGDRYPVFVDCPDFITGSHCDMFTAQVRAELPDRDHPNNANIRYHLINGPGEIDERTGLWSWSPGTEYDWRTMVVIAASIGNSPEHTTPPGKHCHFTVEVQDERTQILLNGQPQHSTFFVTAPGIHRFSIDVIDPDICDTRSVRMTGVFPPPAGSIFIDNDDLVFEADGLDGDKKFQVILSTRLDGLGGSHRFYFDTREDPPAPVFQHCPDDMILTQCDQVRYEVLASDPDSIGGGGITYEMVSGPGRIDKNYWLYEPGQDDVNQTYEVEIAARYGPIITTGDENCRFSVTINGQPAGIHAMDFTCGEVIPIPSEISSYFKMRAYGVNCGRISPRIVDVSPTFVGSMDIVGHRGSNSANRETHVLRVTPDSLDAGQTFHVVLESRSFSGEHYTCELDIVVEEPQLYRVRIETLEDVRQGGHAYIDVVLEEGSIPMGRFDFVVGYDASAIAAMVVSPGPFIEQCGWQYFEYRFGPFGPGNDSVPSGQLRISGRALSRATNRYGPDPTCFLPDSLPATLFTIDFLITNDRTFECDSLPIQFYWDRCGDNMIWSKNNWDLFISNDVYDAEDNLLPLVDSLPSLSGVSKDCFDPRYLDRLHRLIDFHHGGIHILCADSIDGSFIGDINLNYVSFEIADAVLFSYYFVYGVDVLNINPALQALASDVNQDGIPLTIEDLQFLIRVIVGEAYPYYKLDVTSSQDPAFFRQEPGGVVSVATPDTLGAAWMVFDGAVAPTLLANGMEMRYAYNDSITRVLVFSLDGHGFTAGPLLGNVDVPLLQVQTCTYRADRVEAIIDQALGVDVDEDLLPTEFALGQNYPNPFNNSTVIQFALPQASDVTVTIYNIIGQALYQRTRYYEAGHHDFVWEGRSSAGEDVAGGVYFYRMQAGSFTETKKMLLLK